MTALAISSLEIETGLLNQQSGSAVSEVDRPKRTQVDTWSDEHLVAAITNQGNEQHFRMLVARYKQKVHRLALSVLGPAERHYAEDVTQEVFVKLYQQLDRFRGDSKFSTWLYRLALNAAIDFRRRNRRHQAEPLEPEHVAGASSDPANLADTLQKQRIHAAVDALPQAQRMMIHLYYWLGMKISEISEIMACPEGTVKVYLARARKSLAGTLGETNDE